MKAVIKKSGVVFVVSVMALVMNGVVQADLPTPLTEGETLNVTGFADATPTSCTPGMPVLCPTLRDAVVFANNNANPAEYDIIQLDPGTYTLSIADATEDNSASGDLDITQPVNIVGADAATTIVDGGGSSGALQERLFDLFSPGVRTGSDPEAAGPVVIFDGVTLNGGYGKHMLGGAIFNDEKSTLTLRNCSFTNNASTWDGDDLTKETQGSGGAVYSKDVLTVDNCVFRSNVAYSIIGEVKVGNGGAINSSQYTVISNSTFGSDDAIDDDSNRAINGGALFVTGGNPVEITNTTLSYNYAISGGGLNAVSKSAGMSVAITNSTISGNHVTDSGAGIESNAPLVLLNVTIANNVKDSSTKGSGLNTGPASDVTAKNVLFDNNLADGLAVSANCGAKSGGFSINTQGGNVSSDDTCDLNLALGDQENATINLESLADNNVGLSGSTLTHALPLVSDAVDTGVNTGCPNNDQRGGIRPFDATLLFTAICDSGAYELYVERTDLHIENMIAPSQVIQGDDVTLQVAVDNGDAAFSATAVAAVLATNLPSELTYVSATTSKGTCDPPVAGVVTCNFGDLAAGEEANVSIVATASTIKSNVIVGTSVSSDTLDPYPSNNLGNVTFDIVEVTDLSLTAAAATPAALNPGGISSVSITIANNGPNDATGVSLSGVIPSIVSFVQGVGCSEAGGVITCDVGLLANGTSADVVFEVEANAVGTASVTATVIQDQMDLDPSDNSGTVDISITAAAVVTSSDDGGGFCAYNPKGKFDAVLPALALFAIASLGYRSLRRRLIRK